MCVRVESFGKPTTTHHPPPGNRASPHPQAPPQMLNPTHLSHPPEQHMSSHVDEQIQARIAAEAQKRARRRRQRAELDEARQYGLQARHTAKLARWQKDEDPE